MKGAIAKADELAKEIPNSFVPGQFVNPANPDAHKRTTGPEIWEDTDGKVDIFVAGVGTGGTVTGVGEYLKSQNPAVKVVAVEPATSPVLSKGTAGAHKIQGIGAGFVPDVLNTKVYDEVIPVANEDAFATGKLVGHKEGVLVGISSGAARVGCHPAGQAPREQGQDHCGPAARHRRPLSVHPAVRGLIAITGNLCYNKGTVAYKVEAVGAGQVRPSAFPAMLCQSKAAGGVCPAPTTQQFSMCSTVLCCTFFIQGGFP